jgi:hypothetical protein
MDTTIVSGLAGIVGTMCGGSASVAAAWVTHKGRAKRDGIRAAGAKERGDNLPRHQRPVADVQLGLTLPAIARTLPTASSVCFRIARASSRNALEAPAGSRASRVYQISTPVPTMIAAPKVPKARTIASGSIMTVAP